MGIGWVSIAVHERLGYRDGMMPALLTKPRPQQSELQRGNVRVPRQTEEEEQELQAGVKTSGGEEEEGPQKEEEEEEEEERKYAPVKARGQLDGGRVNVEGEEKEDRRTERSSRSEKLKSQPGINLRAAGTDGGRGDRKTGSDGGERGRASARRRAAAVGPSSG
ncbi:unnamed protein product [Pleuronectes platessa]|uniref:Uncharacterized protein n=1 Tax=Pleuronectes platessa TaxID=8262 RepID=A0A9N7VYC6_PLEPL|nr:unnamed protein product [Pleuronectes platessa]